MKFKLDIKVNSIIKHFLLADTIFLGGWGLIAPIFAVFVLDQVPNATIFTVGAASALYWIIKSVLQIPISIYLDKHEGERDDFYTLILSLALAGFSAMAFLLIKNITGLFIVQFIHAAAFALYTPSWSAMYARHLDKNHFSFDWSLDSTLLGVAHSITALLGGVMAVTIGFESVFILISILSFASVFVMFSVPHLIFPKTTNEGQIIFRDHSPRTIEK